MLGRKLIRKESGYSLKTDESALKLVVDGVEYIARLDTPEFLAWWKENQGRFNAKSEPEEQVRLVVEFMASMLGAEQAQKMFNGVPRSLTQYVGLLGYVFDQIAEQGYADKLQAPMKYSKSQINR